MVYITVSQSLRTSDQSEIQADHDQGVILWPKEFVFKEKVKFDKNLISNKVVGTHNIIVN